MSWISQRLRIKYGLGVQPSDDQIRLWANRTHEYIEKGISPEEAGRHAAKEILPGYALLEFKTEADTIETLLNAVRNK